MDVHGKYTEVLIRWMERIAAGQPPLIFGDGTQTMDFVYVEDVARANVLAARSPTSSDDVFNVASGAETSLRELAAALLQVMGSRPRSPSTARERSGQPGAASPGRREQGARGCSASRPRSASRRACARLVAWWREQRRRRTAAAIPMIPIAKPVWARRRRTRRAA